MAEIHRGSYATTRAILAVVCSWWEKLKQTCRRRRLVSTPISAATSQLLLVSIEESVVDGDYDLLGCCCMGRCVGTTVDSNSSFCDAIVLFLL
jgi:hypothetical protein